MIPKIIHQTWKTKNLPVNFKKYSSTWKNFHPIWDYKLYDDNDCLAIVKKYFPQFLDTYLNLPIPVMKADMFRYMILYQFGGLYADIDAEALKPFDDLIEKDDTMIVGTEINFNNLAFSKFNPVYKNYYKKHNMLIQYVQYVFLSSPKNPILYQILEYIKKNNASNSGSSHIDTFLITGPAIFSYIIHNNINKVKVLDVEKFNGVTSIIGRYILGINKSTKENYVLHHEAASWKNRNDIIYTLLMCVILALLITTIIFFIYSIIYFKKCKGNNDKRCINVIKYCKIKKILIIFATILILLCLIIMINFAIKDKAFWPF